MSALHSLIKVYDACIDKQNRESDVKKRLVPVNFMLMAVQLEITIDEDGKYKKFGLVEGDTTTLAPVTEESSTRSGSKVSPMPLVENTSYIVKKYHEFMGKKEEKHAEKYEAYIKQLKRWIDYVDGKGKSYGESKIYLNAVYKYLTNNDLISDCENDKNSNEKIKIKNDNVRFVVKCETNGKEKYLKWDDEDLISSYKAYMESCNNEGNTGNYDLDYITGTKKKCAENVPAKIRSLGDQAKLISHNDKKGLVYRGRFADYNQVCTVSSEMIQKAQNALRWLIAIQGRTIGSECIVVWTTENKDLPNLFEGSEGLFASLKKVPEKPKTGRLFANEVMNALEGYKQELECREVVSIIAIDSSSVTKENQKGRLAIAYYYENEGEYFFETINKWYTELKWIDYKENKVFSPSMKQIAEAVYGEKVSEKERTKNEKFIRIEKMITDRLLPCISERRKIPLDIVRTAVKNVSNPMKYGNEINVWLEMMDVTCALINKERIDYGKGEFDVEVNLENIGENKDRSFLYGRLLAIFDYVEARVLYEDAKKGGNLDEGKTLRITNAKRYWNSYTVRPNTTCKTLQAKLQQGSIPKMAPNIWAHYSNMISVIMADLYETDGFNDAQLEPEYLLGYYIQNLLLWKKNEKEEENK